MKMWVLDNGKIVMEAHNEVTKASDAAEIPAIPIHSFLFDTPKGYVLFDTSCDPEGMTKNWPEYIRANPYVASPEQSMAGQLALLGLTPDDISYVILSHLHLDHAGELALFRKAKILVSKEEYLKTMHAYADDTLDTFHLKTDIESWLRAELDWQFIEKDCETVPFCEGLTILNLGSGHSFGMIGLLVELDKDGNFVLAVDSCNDAEHFGPPALLAGIAYDPDGYFRIIEKLRGIADEKKATVLFGHDMAQFLSLKKAAEGCYQ